MTVTGAFAQNSITLSGTSANTCTFSAINVKPDGSLEVACGGTSTSPGVFNLAATVLTQAVSTTNASNVRIVRSGGSSGAADVTFDLSGTNNCTSGGLSGGTISFANGETTKYISITTGAAAQTSCTVTISAPTAGTLGTTVTKTITSVDPQADVTFGFALDTSTEVVGGGTHQIVVTRSGGTANAWSVPFTLSGSLTLNGQLIAGTGTTSPTATTGVLSFPQNSSQAILTYTAPSVTPTSPTLPATLTIVLGTPTTTASTTQNGSIDPAANSHTMTLSGPAAGCPAPTVSKDLPGAGTWVSLNLPSGSVSTWNMPTPQLGRSNLKISLSETTTTFPVSPWSYEIHINKCKGLVQPTTGDKCYAISGNKTLFELWAFTKLGTTTAYDTEAEIKSRACYAPAADGPYYVNIRYNYAGCTIAGGVCGWHLKWYTGGSY